MLCIFLMSTKSYAFPALRTGEWGFTSTDGMLKLKGGRFSKPVSLLAVMERPAGCSARAQCQGLGTAHTDANVTATQFQALIVQANPHFTRSFA
jgi:hypothetical protein